jgi:hypothetical protein
VVACWAAFGRRAIWAKTVFTLIIVALGTVVNNWYAVTKISLPAELLNDLGFALVMISTLLLYRWLGYRWRPEQALRQRDHRTPSRQSRRSCTGKVSRGI